jgi:hypothetical protein
MNLDQTLAAITKYTDVINEIFRIAERDKLTHTEILSKWGTLVLHESPYQDMPRWGRAELEGYCNGMLQGHVRFLTERRWVLDGNQFSDGPEKEEAFKGRWADVKYDGIWYKGSDKQFIIPK